MVTITDEMRAEILANTQTSARALAKSLGCSATAVRKVRASGGESVRTETERAIQARKISWVDRAELLAEDVERMLQKAANDPESRKDPKLIHAICGGVKIVFDALGDWKMSNAGGNAKAPGEEGAIPEDSNSAGGATITPIRAAG